MLLGIENISMSYMAKDWCVKLIVIARCASLLLIVIYVGNKMENVW